MQVLSSISPRLEMHAMVFDVLQTMFTRASAADQASNGARFANAVRRVAGRFSTLTKTLTLTLTLIHVSTLNQTFNPHLPRAQTLTLTLIQEAVSRIALGSSP